MLVKGGKEKVGSLGSGLLFRPVSREVPSALEGLTAGFGMEPGVSPPLEPPKEPALQTIGKERDDGALRTEQDGGLQEEDD